MKQSPIHRTQSIVRGMLAMFALTLVFFTCNSFALPQYKAVAFVVGACAVGEMFAPKVDLYSSGLLVGTFTGSTQYLNQQVQIAIGALAFKISSADYAELSSYEISVDKVSKNGSTVPFITRTNLQHLAEINALGEGAIKEVESATAASEIVYLVVNLVADDYAHKLETDEYFQINIFSATAAHSIELYGLENARVTDNYTKIDKYEILAGTTTKTFANPQGEQMAIVAANLTDVTLTYINGRSVTHTKTELEIMHLLANDMVRISSQIDDSDTFITSGSDKLLFVSLENVTTVKLTVSGATVVYFIDEIDPDNDGKA